MRKFIKRYLPNHEALRENRWMAMFGTTLFHPRLWHLNRHSAAGGVAVGLFCGLIPGPFQMLGAAIGCVVLRVNLPLALVCTLYTNPFTIVPLYLAAYALGVWVLGENGRTITPPPELGDLSFFSWIETFGQWLAGMGYPLALGLVLMACGLAVIGYIAVKGFWRWHLIHRWHKRGHGRI